MEFTGDCGIKVMHRPSTNTRNFFSILLESQDSRGRKLELCGRACNGCEQPSMLHHAESGGRQKMWFSVEDILALGSDLVKRKRPQAAPETWLSVLSFSPACRKFSGNQRVLEDKPCQWFEYAIAAPHCPERTVPDAGSWHHEARALELVITCLR